jgi:hypothetical protein
VRVAAQITLPATPATREALRREGQEQQLARLLAAPRPARSLPIA